MQKDDYKHAEESDEELNDHKDDHLDDELDAKDAEGHEGKDEGDELDAKDAEGHESKDEGNGEGDTGNDGTRNDEGNEGIRNDEGNDGGEELETLRAELSALKSKLAEQEEVITEYERKEKEAKLRKRIAQQVADENDVDAVMREVGESLIEEDDQDVIFASIDDTLRDLRITRRKQGADPKSKGNGAIRPPKQVDGREVGRATAQRILQRRRRK